MRHSEADARCDGSKPLRETEVMNADAHMDREALTLAELKHAMGSFATGIAIVTTRFEGVDYGMTCNSFNTVSLQPALVLWSIQRSTRSYPAFLNGGGYTVSVLSDSQRNLVKQFTLPSYEERFAGVPVTRLPSGRLMIDGAAAWFDCSLENAVEAGDHDVLIGRVGEFASDQARTPIGYVRGRFTAMDG